MSTLVTNVRFVAKPGREKEVKEVLLTLLESTRLEEGCIATELYQHHDDPTRIALMGDWVGVEALAMHFEMPHLKVALAALEDLLVEPYSLRKLTEIQ
ncbi:putative quinol monooxygenase [Nocardia sp. CNY236]|uniref:putative quinol monooxygenase n=1 Tax=Nocardia sp. CNY236 TaxID=1169152 RepID=UPI00048BD628|nr:putative quinol monooxygenase [Nocardia sp. CNY236]